MKQLQTHNNHISIDFFSACMVACVCNDDYVNGQGFCCDDAPANAPMKAAKRAKENNNE